LLYFSLDIPASKSKVKMEEYLFLMRKIIPPDFQAGYFYVKKGKLFTLEGDEVIDKKTMFDTLSLCG
jgi:hypothetical protein